MRTLCDVCEAAPARYFCAADEAALCAKCDEKIHGCNKLAVRHVRLELAEARKVSPCDVCETNPAYFFCGIDGTSLCLQCDMDVHVGGKRTHERYLLMGQRVELPNSFCNKDVGPLKQTESLKDYQRLASSDTQKHLHQNQHHDQIGHPKCSDDWNNSNAPAAAIAIGEARSIDCHQVDSISRPPHFEGGHVRGHQRESGDEQVSSSDDECMGVVPELYLKDTQTAEG